MFMITLLAYDDPASKSRAFAYAHSPDELYLLNIWFVNSDVSLTMVSHKIT
jgi:hypothetical protein